MDAVGSPTYAITLTFVTKIQCMEFFLGIPATSRSGLVGITRVGTGVPGIWYYASVAIEQDYFGCGVRQ